MQPANMLQKFKLEGKIALITGGTRGIGLATAYAFGEAGAKLYLSARREEYEDSGALLEAGYDVTFYPADLMTRAAANTLVNKVIEDAGRIDVLVNNARVAKSGDNQPGSVASVTSLEKRAWRSGLSDRMSSEFRYFSSGVSRVKLIGVARKIQP